MVIGGISRSLVNFRGPLLREMVTRGHEVWGCAGDARDDVVETLSGMGVSFAPIHLSRAGLRPWSDLHTCWDLMGLMRRIRPDVVLAYTIKAVIWGGLAARMCRVPAVFSLITGLGYAFVERPGLKGRLLVLSAEFLYRLGVRRSRKVFFQNRDDASEFLERRVVTRQQGVVVNGSGVDLSYYGRAPLPVHTQFLMICRLLIDKGVREYVKAAREIHTKFPDVVFQLAGSLDQNPRSISRKELSLWEDGVDIEYLGQVGDVRPAYRECSVYVLPSYYREGTPRTILEAMAHGRPIITTDMPGCRETVPLTEKGRAQRTRCEGVMEGENGFLVRARDSEALAEAMAVFLREPDLVTKMGRRSREIAEKKYDVGMVNRAMLETMGL